MNQSTPICLTDAQRSLVENNIGLVGYTITRFGSQGLGNNDDTFQVGVLGLINAAAHYDSSRSSFSTYAVRCILHELRREWRYRHRQRRVGQEQSLSLDYPCGDEATECLMDRISNGDPGIDARLQDADLCGRVLAMLREEKSLTANMTLEHLFAGASQKEISERFGLSQSRVSAVIRRKKRELAKRLAGQGGARP